MFQWKVATVAAGVIALGVSAGAAINSANDHTSEVAEAAALVSQQRCAAGNATAEVLRSSLRAQLKLTETRLTQQQITRAQYTFSRAALTRAIAKLEPQDCTEQAALIRRAVNK